MKNIDLEHRLISSTSFMLNHLLMMLADKQILTPEELKEIFDISNDWMKK